ncbi:MAG: DUF1566 domain-containing protein [Alistipes sp.]|nr:DUF1566 domain-containing protein [Alistipes sp.]
MKHLFWAMALLLCVGCSGSNSSEKERLAEAEAARIEKSIEDGLGRDGIYQVGDYYNRDFNKGIVFDVTNGGRNGKILSLDETYCNWSDAKQWCRNHGKGWYLPTEDELKEIYRNKRNVNEGLRKYNREELRDSFYWSSTEYDSDCAWSVHMNNGNADGTKLYDTYVRAVFAF